MNDLPSNTEPDQPAITREEMVSAMFANMVIQQTNMAMMLMGKVAHPETGQFMNDLGTAKMFIDQLEMLEAKTRGNLSKPEEGLMKQALGTLHMTFVEAVAEAEKGGAKTEEPAASAPAPKIEPAPAASAAETKPAPAPMEPLVAADESRKKFSKKY